MTTATVDVMVRVKGVSKRFGRNVALRGIDLELAVGDRLALFGPNGSGKTTLLRVLAGLLPPSGGSVEIGGAGYQHAGQAVRGRIGVVAHHTYLYDDLTGEENLSFYGRMYGIQRLRERVEESLALAGLERRARDKVRAYSRGMQQRLALARATLHDPDLLLLDEPDTGLDQDAFAHLGGFLERPSGPPRSVVMATHDLKLGHLYCGRFAILTAGRIVFEGRQADGDLAALERLYSERTLAKERSAES